VVPVSITIASLALIISAITAYLTLFHRGTIKMTRPTLFYFGPDGPNGSMKVFLRTLLYCTSRSGRVVESMYIKLRRSESSQIFNIWVYGDKNLARGSGLFVGKEGVVCNHHFLLPKDGTEFKFLPGKYAIETYAQVVDLATPLLLSREEVFLSEKYTGKLGTVNAGVYFDWGPDSQQYVSHLDRDKTAELNYTLREEVRRRSEGAT